MKKTRSCDIIYNLLPLYTILGRFLVLSCVIRDAMGHLVDRLFAVGRLFAAGRLFAVGQLLFAERRSTPVHFLSSFLRKLVNPPIERIIADLQ